MMVLHFCNVNNIIIYHISITPRCLCRTRGNFHTSPLVWAAPPESRAQQWPVAFHRRNLSNAPLVVWDRRFVNAKTQAAERVWSNRPGHVAPDWEIRLEATGEVNVFYDVFVRERKTTPFTIQFTLVFLHSNIVPPTFKHPWNVSCSLKQKARESGFRFDKTQLYQAKWQKVLPMNGTWITRSNNQCGKIPNAGSWSLGVNLPLGSCSWHPHPWPCTLHLQRRATLPSVQASEVEAVANPSSDQFQLAMPSKKKCGSLLLKIPPWLIVMIVAVTSQTQLNQNTFAFASGHAVMLAIFTTLARLTLRLNEATEALGSSHFCRSDLERKGSPAFRRGQHTRWKDTKPPACVQVSPNPKQWK